MVSARVEHVANLRGRKGDTGAQGLQGAPGTFVGATAESVPATEPASVSMSGPGTARVAHFRIPVGLPGVNAVPTDEAIETLIRNRDTLTHDSLTRRFPDKGGDLSNMPDFNHLSFDTNVASKGSMESIGYPCVISNRDGFIPGYPNYVAFYGTDHASGGTQGIYMATFDQHGDPWVNPTVIMNRGTQLETPWVVKDVARNRLLMYGSGSGMAGEGERQTAHQVTVCWTTTPERFAADPTDWTYEGISHDWESSQAGLMPPESSGAWHCGYQKVAVIGGGFVSIGLVNGGDSTQRDTWYSVDGTKFYRGYAPIRNHPDLNESNRMMNPNQLFEWNGQVWATVLYRPATSGASTGENLDAWLAIGRVRDDLSGFAGRVQAIFHVPQTGPGGNGDLRGTSLLVEDSELHFYYGSTIDSLGYAKAVL